MNYGLREIEYTPIPELESLYSGCFLEPVDKELFNLGLTFSLNILHSTYCQ